MSTISTVLTTDVVNAGWLTKTNDNFTALNTDKAELSWGTFTGDILVPDESYGVGWNGSVEVPTKNAIYDKIEALPVLSDGDKGDITVSWSGATWTIDNNVVTNAKQATVATNTIKGRTTAGTGNVEDLTPTQVAWMLPVATTSVAGTMSASDKTKLDGLSNLNKNWTITDISRTFSWSVWAALWTSHTMTSDAVAYIALRCDNTNTHVRLLKNWSILYSNTTSSTTVTVFTVFTTGDTYQVEVELFAVSWNWTWTVTFTQ